MSKITEIIPADFPEWMQDAFDEGQFFRIVMEKVSALEASNRQMVEILGAAANNIRWYIENSPVANGYDDEALEHIEQALKSAPLERYQAMDKVIEAALMFKRSNLAKDIVTLHNATANLNRIMAGEK